MSGLLPGGAPAGAASGQSSFTLRILKVVVTAADGTTYTFDGSPLSWAPFVPGLAIECEITAAMLPYVGVAMTYIYGMTLDQMNALSIAGGLWQINTGNKIAIYAGGTTGPGGDAPMTLVHSGYIVEARPEFNAMPDVRFFIQSNAAIDAQMNNTVTPTSFKGATSFDTVAGAIAQKTGRAYRGYGTNGPMMNNPYFCGSAHDQFCDATQAYKVRGAYDVNGDFVAFSQTGSIPGGVATISPQNGMIGYPEFQAATVGVRTIFDPAIADVVQAPGHQIQIQSQLSAATGTFVIANLNYSLSCNREDGPWEIGIRSYPAGRGKSGA